MMVDVSRFKPYNIIDSCAVSNVLLSGRLFHVARNAGCVFCCAYYVLYECLVKQPKIHSDSYVETKKRLEQARKSGSQFQEIHIDIEDLQDADVMSRRKRVDKGELASIALAKKIRQAFLTDDQNARRFGEDVLGTDMVQTTPHLFGWLFFENHLTDADKDPILAEHKRFGRPLGPYLERTYLWALECRLKQSSTGL